MAATTATERIATPGAESAEDGEEERMKGAKEERRQGS